MADAQSNKLLQENIKLQKEAIVQAAAYLKSIQKGSTEYKNQLTKLKDLKKELVQLTNNTKKASEIAEKIKEIDSTRADKTKQINSIYLGLNKREQKSVNLYGAITSLSQGVADKLKIASSLQAGMTQGGEDLTKTYNTSANKLNIMGGLIGDTVGFQDEAADLALKMAENYEKMGTGDFQDMSSEVDALQEKVLKKRNEINNMLSAGNYPKELEASLREELKIVNEATNALDKKNVEYNKTNNLANEASSMLTKPFDMMKSTMESLPFGGLASQIVGLDQIQSDFTAGIAKSTSHLIKQFMATGKVNQLMVNNIKGQMTKAIDGLNQGFSQLNALTGGMLGPILLVVGAIMLASKVMKMFFGGTMETRKELGITTMEAAGLQNTINSTAMEFQFLGVSASDVKDVAMGIADNMGGVSEVSRETVSAFASLNAHMGVSGAVSTQLATTMMAIGASSATAAAGQLESVGHLARQSGVAPAKIMEDMASDMEFFSSFAKDGGVNLAKSAIMARKLGVNMATVSKMADSLLDFESSINDQMEAQMLTGKSINTDKAREMALNGDLAGMQKEIVSQVGSEAEFNRLNVVQRQAMAKAFGVSVQDLSSMVANQEKLNNMTDAQKQTQDIIAKLMEFAGKAMTGFLSAGKALLPVVAGIGVAMLVAFYPITLAVLGITAIGAGFNYLNKQVPMLGTFLGVALGLITAFKVQSMLAGKSLGGGMLSGAKSLVGGLKDKLTGGSAAASVSGKGGGMGSSIAKSGKGMGAGLKGLSKGVGAVANPKVLLGLAALTLAVIGIGYALKLAAPGIKAFGEAMGGIIQSVGSALVGIIGAIGDFGVKLMTIASPTVALGLFATAGGFGALAASMAAFSAAGLLAIPAMIAVGAFNAVTGGGEGGGAKKDGVETKIEMTNQKLDKLIELMGSDGDIAQNLIGVRKNTGGFIDTINMA
tara:strand:- start:214 stop:3042 length:2829 start_codon:yes stop_codon:yes gene_type:complete